MPARLVWPCLFVAAAIGCQQQQSDLQEEIAGLEERIAALEQQPDPAPPAAAVQPRHELELVDASGQVRLQMFADPPQIKFLDGDGSQRMQLALGRDGTGYVLMTKRDSRGGGMVPALLFEVPPDGPGNFELGAGFQFTNGVMLQYGREISLQTVR